MNLTEVILGSPGTGKTQELLRLLRQELAAGIAPDQVAFLAFTNAAADEARERTIAELGLTREELPWFRTLHSACFMALGLGRNEVLGRRHWRELGELLGLRFTVSFKALDGPLETTDKEGDRLRALHQLALARDEDPLTLWQALGAGVRRERVIQFERTLAEYKADQALVDFSDMLRLFVERDLALPVKVAFVDEAQDLTREQWLTLETALREAERVYVAGDDDQAIYHWAGADVQRFLKLAAPTRVLPVSYRLPRTVFQHAERVIVQVRERYEKAWRPTERPGELLRHVEPEQVALGEREGTWLLLGRHRHQLERLARCCRDQGVPYSVYGISAVDRAHVTTIQRYEALRAGKALAWEEAEDVVRAMELDPYVPPAEAVGHVWTAAELGLDCSQIWHDALVGIELAEREFLLTCLRRNESLTKEPRVRVSTIHGAKGQEADHVLVLSDLTARTWHGMMTEPDAEHRVFYVAATRARETLHLVEPQTSQAYVW